MTRIYVQFVSVSARAIISVGAIRKIYRTPVLLQSE